MSKILGFLQYCLHISHMVMNEVREFYFCSTKVKQFRICQMCCFFLSSETQAISEFKDKNTERHFLVLLILLTFLLYKNNVWKLTAGWNNCKPISTCDFLYPVIGQYSCHSTNSIVSLEVSHS